MQRRAHHYVWPIKSVGFIIIIQILMFAIVILQIKVSDFKEFYSSLRQK